MTNTLTNKQRQSLKNAAAGRQAEDLSAAIPLPEMGKLAKHAAAVLAAADTGRKNSALANMAEQLLLRQEEILAANAEDLARARQNGMSDAFLDRLTLSEKRIADMAEGIRALIELPDPIGEEMARWRAAEDIEIIQTRVPIGVIGIIYEARPNVTADAAAICLKCGNAVILRGGSDALASNLSVAAALREGLAAADLPRDCVQIVADTSHRAADELMRLNEYLDVLIPRGGAGLIKTVLAKATVPVIETGSGNCHIYIEETAQPEMARDIVLNARVQRPAVCNSAEKLLIDAACAEKLLPEVASALAEAGVELRCCPQSLAILQAAGIAAIPAAGDDWGTEYNALIMACKVVADCGEAVAHINRFGTRHSECIVTENSQAAAFFQRNVDAAAVYVNASTRFTDGFQFGFGAEIGISTQKLHARGPMGLLAMTSYKYLINGTGQIRP